MSGWLLPGAIALAAMTSTYFCCVRPMRRGSCMTPVRRGKNGDDLDRALGEAREELRQLQLSQPSGDSISPRRR